MEEHIPADELLLVRDSHGQHMRPFAPPPGITPRQGAVLALFYPDGEDLRLPLTVRSERLANHRGEVSLPGGGVDPHDTDRQATALRECHEELGVDPTTITIWGQLNPIYITPSNFQITPVVGFCAVPPVFVANPGEVSAIITTTVRVLLDRATVSIEPRNLRGYDLLVPFFTITGHTVWGATALILSDLVARMRRVLANSPI
jgi:8-oxo-dGTP pyrophosphatase MutT (NUDIX family)